MEANFIEGQHGVTLEDVASYFKVPVEHAHAYVREFWATVLAERFLALPNQSLRQFAKENGISAPTLLSYFKLITNQELQNAIASRKKANRGVSVHDEIRHQQLTVALHLIKQGYSIQALIDQQLTPLTYWQLYHGIRELMNQMPENEKFQVQEILSANSHRSQEKIGRTR